MTTIYEALENAVLSHINPRGYPTDLTEYDRNTIEENPKRPFIHFTRNCGTVMIALLNSDEYPPHGERIPYCFGQSDRYWILSQVLTMVEYCISGREPYFDAVYYFDGEKLMKITHKKALSTAQNYVHRMRGQWRKCTV